MITGEWHPQEGPGSSEVKTEKETALSEKRPSLLGAYLVCKLSSHTTQFVLRGRC